MQAEKVNSRRDFISKLAAGTAMSVASIGASLPVFGGTRTASLASDADSWFKKAKGSHRVVFDATEPHDGLPFIWPWVYYGTNNHTGSPDDDITAMVVLRHNAIPFAMEDRLWKKYNFGKAFNVKDNSTSEFALRNPYYEPKPGDFPFPEIDGIKNLQGRGAMFCVCDMALTVYSGMIAGQSGLDPEEVKNDWLQGVLKDVQIVPSGVWAVGRAQENGFGYCYAGG